MGWKQEFNCRNCTMIEYINQPPWVGNYCMAGYLGQKAIHADDDFVVRCDSYTTEPRQGTFMDMAKRHKEMTGNNGLGEESY